MTNHIRTTWPAMEWVWLRVSRKQKTLVKFSVNYAAKEVGCFMLQNGLNLINMEDQ